MIAASARLPTIESGAAPSPTMIAASARLLSIETGIAPSPAMSRYDDHNGHPALDFVPGRPLVDEPAVECPDEPPSKERLGRY